MTDPVPDHVLVERRRATLESELLTVQQRMARKVAALTEQLATANTQLDAASEALNDCRNTTPTKPKGRKGGTTVAKAGAATAAASGKDN